MQIRVATFRSFRNLADASIELPPGGVALLGANGHGKTNLLEAFAYPVLFRSLRGSRDRDVARFGGRGFHLTVETSTGREVAVTWDAASRGKQVLVDGQEFSRIADALGAWLAVTFLPNDLALVQGAATERRKWLDRMLSLGEPVYLEALLKYRAAVAQRNAALRREDIRSASAFDQILAKTGSVVVGTRLRWVEGAGIAWQEELDRLGEPLNVGMAYRGNESLSQPENWPAMLAASLERDQLRGQTHVGPHRDELVLQLAGRSLREFGSTGQHRTAAIGLRLVEHKTLKDDRETIPALLVDDIFAELDSERQKRLAARLQETLAQLVVTAPRGEDLPAALEVPRWYVDEGQIRQA